MLKVKGIYDGRKVEISEKIVIPDGESQEVIVIFPDMDGYIEPFDLDKFIKDWSSAEIEAIEEIYDNRESFFEGREFDL